MLVTIFTPTYNRAYILENLYKSLCRQTIKNFEWIIVDDGSKDNTETLIYNFQNENKIAIQYVKQTNAGKHVAINKGLNLANGEIFFIVDSDDQLSEDAVEWLIYQYKQIEYNNDIAGISGVKISFDGNRFGGDMPFLVKDCSALDFRYKYHVKGDMSEAIKTEVFKQFPFPVFEGEHFCPEAVVWNRMACKYKLRYVNEPIYKCEYRPDGLTAKIVKLRMQSPEASMLCYSELYGYKIPFLQKIKAAINFWRFAFCSKKSFNKKLRQIGFFALILLPIGFLFHLKDLQS